MWITSFPIERHGFGFARKLDLAEEVEDSKMHSHADTFELIYIIRGSCSYMVEGKRYQIAPGDIVITRPDEIHMMVHDLPHQIYERVNLIIPGNFFVDYRCEALKTAFINRKNGAGNLVPAEAVRQRKIPDIIADMERYCAENAPELELVMNGKLIELLYNLNLAVPPGDTRCLSSGRVQEIMNYINMHLNMPLSIDRLSAEFHLSKGHICHIFKDQTGMTINKYITHKRLLRAQELYSAGAKLIDACSEAGFGNYSTFHRMYVKTFGTTPKAGMDGRIENCGKREAYRERTRILC